VALALLAAACADDESRAVEVTTTEYEFAGIPAELPPGPVTFEVRNDGGENHDLVLRKVILERDILEVLELSQVEQGDYLEDAGATPAIPPGEMGSLAASLETGTYAYLCLVTTESGRPHAFAGMRGTVEVG
jgi:plastocyanin